MLFLLTHPLSLVLAVTQIHLQYSKSLPVLVFERNHIMADELGFISCALIRALILRKFRNKFRLPSHGNISEQVLPSAASAGVVYDSAALCPDCINRDDPIFHEIIE